MIILSRHDIQSADLSFDPPLSKMAKTRQVFLIASQGAIIAGIKYTKKNGLVIPPILHITNRPESASSSKGIEQPIDQTTRETLAARIHEKLDKGIPLWPHSARTDESSYR